MDDPIIAEVRDARHRLAARFGNDLATIGDAIMVRQISNGARLHTAPPLKEPDV